MKFILQIIHHYSALLFIMRFNFVQRREGKA
jgi:hypothetical protein